MEEPANDHQIAEAHREVVEPLWIEPLFEELADDVPLAEEGTQVVAESRAGYAPLALRRRLEDDIRMIALDPKRAMLDAARTRAEEEELDQIFFVPERVDAISYADGVFNTSICLNGIVTGRQADEGFAELARVTEEGGTIAVAAPLSESFAVFYDMLDEAFRAHELDEEIEKIETLRKSLISPARLVRAALDAGLEVTDVDRVEWSVSFERGQELLNSPLIRETFFPHWVGIISSEHRDQILRYIGQAMDTYWLHSDVETTLRAAFLVAEVPEAVEDAADEE